MRRLSFSKRAILFWLSGWAIMLSTGGWLIGDYIWVKYQREVQDLRVKAQAQRERLSALQGQAKDIQVLLVNWKGLQKKIQASLPPKHKASLNGHPAVEELETSLTSLQGELERLIAFIPSGWPVDGHVSSGVGMRRSPWTGKPEFHSGLDIPKRKGTPVYAPGDGVVESVEKNKVNGRMVVLNHGQGITTRYAHLSKTHVKKGDKVRKGQQIANVGNTGKSTSSHLHYEVRVNGVPIDPRRNLIK